MQKGICDGLLQELIFCCAEITKRNLGKKEKKKGLHGYKKGFERNMIVISNQTAPSLFLFTPNWPLSLRGRTEPAMKSLLSPANPAHWAHVHRQPSEKAAVTGPVCGESLMKPNEISLLKVSHVFSFNPFFFFFFNHSSGSSASPPHRSLTKRHRKVPAQMRVPGNGRKSHFSTPF